MPTTISTGDVRVHQLSPKEAHKVFDQEARDTLGMSGQEFVERWNAGKFEDPNDPKVTWLASMLSLYYEK